MWYVNLSVDGCCPECGEDLSGPVQIHATKDWTARFESDERLQRGITHSMARIVKERHARVCAARRRQHTAYAATA